MEKMMEEVENILEEDLVGDDTQDLVSNLSLTSDRVKKIQNNGNTRLSNGLNKIDEIEIDLSSDLEFTEDVKNGKGGIALEVDIGGGMEEKHVLDIISSSSNREEVDEIEDELDVEKIKFKVSKKRRESKKPSNLVQSGTENKNMSHHLQDFNCLAQIQHQNPKASREHKNHSKNYSKKLKHYKHISRSKQKVAMTNDTIKFKGKLTGNCSKDQNESRQN